jgi:hypothetical protein
MSLVLLLLNLIAEVAPINASLMGLAQAHPELAPAVEQMIMILKEGIIQSVTQMQTQGSEGGTPAY